MRWLFLGLVGLVLAVSPLRAHDLNKSIDLPVPMVEQALENTAAGAYSTSYLSLTADQIAGWSGKGTVYSLRVSNGDAVLDDLDTIQETLQVGNSDCDEVS